MNRWVVLRQHLVLMCTDTRMAKNTAGSQHRGHTCQTHLWHSVTCVQATTQLCLHNKLWLQREHGGTPQPWVNFLGHVGHALVRCCSRLGSIFTLCVWRDARLALQRLRFNYACSGGQLFACMYIWFCKTTYFWTHHTVQQHDRAIGYACSEALPFPIPNPMQHSGVV